MFPIHRPGEITSSHELPAGRNFSLAISLSKKIYNKKIYLHANNQLRPYFLFKDIAEILQNCYFRYFSHAWSWQPKMVVLTYRKPWYQLHRFLLSWDIANMLQIYFGYFLYVWSCLPKTIVSICRNLGCFCMQKINLIPHFFPKILHFKDSCNLIGQKHFDS